MKYDFTDHAFPILRDADLAEEQKAEIWDAFNSKSPSELLTHLHTLDLPPDLKQQLFSAKQRSMPVPETPVEKVVAHLNSLKEIDSASLDAAEQHPTVAAAIIKSAFEKQG